MPFSRNQVSLLLHFQSRGRNVTSFDRSFASFYLKYCVIFQFTLTGFTGNDLLFGLEGSTVNPTILYRHLTLPQLAMVVILTHVRHTSLA